MRPYLSLDLETSALPVDKAEVLEIAVVFDFDANEDTEKLPSWSHIAKLKSLSYAEPFALNMNARLLKIMAEGKSDKLLDANGIFSRLLATVTEASKACVEFDEAKGWKPSKKVYIAGKNVAAFDIPLLLSWFKRQGVPYEMIELLNGYIHYKTLDPGSMYAADLGFIPSLGEINKLVDPTRSDEAAHEALEDALDVVRAIRFKEKKNV